MAKIGLKYPVYSPLTETATEATYGVGAVLGKAVEAKVEIETSDAKVYGDDAVAESEQAFSSGTISMGVDDLYDVAKVALLGYTEGATVDATTGAKELIASETSSGPYVGFGFYGKVVRNKVSYWRAVWLRKVQFKEPSDEFATKGEKPEFSTATIEGVVMVDVTGKWKNEATFNTEAKAKAWLEGKAGIVAKCATPISDVASGTYTAAQTVSLTSATSTAKIYVTQDGTIPSATNGYEQIGPIVLAKPSNTCIKAIAIKAGVANSDILEVYVTVTA